MIDSGEMCTPCRIILLSLLLAASSLKAEDRFFDSAGIRIRYVEQGSGTVVVLLHGYGGSSKAWFDSGIFANLAQDHRVIALDLRGHGLSGKPHNPKAYGEEMGLDVVRMMEHLHISKAHMVGYSMGARILGKLLVTHPQRFLSATLGGSPPRLGWPASEAERAEKDAQHQEQSKPVDGQDFAALAAVARGRASQAVTAEQLGAVKVPTLGIVGSEDPSLPGLREVKALMPAMKDLLVLEGSNHGTTMKRPKFIKAVRQHLR